MIHLLFFYSKQHRNVANVTAKTLPMELAWSYTSVIPALGRLRQEDHEFAASLGFKTFWRPCPKKKKKKVYW
jgi:hypothetical protein